MYLLKGIIAFTQLYYVLLHNTFLSLIMSYIIKQSKLYKVALSTK